MELRVLRYFLTLAREETISRAADALFITQPTLSRQLAELEAELGVKLFERGKRKITLTEDGMLLRRRAEEMIDLEDKTEREFRQREENLSGVIAIGAAETKASEILPKLIASFREKYPAVTFDLQSDIASRVKEGLDRGLLDVGLLIEPGDLEKYNFIRLGMEDRCGILMSVQSPLAQRDYVTVDDLIGLPIVANQRPSVQAFYRTSLGEAYDRLNVIATFNLINNAAHFARQNLGYVFTLESTITEASGYGTCFKPFYPELRQPSFLIWKKYQPLSRLVKKFTEEIIMLFRHDQ